MRIMFLSKAASRLAGAIRAKTSLQSTSMQNSRVRELNTTPATLLFDFKNAHPTLYPNDDDMQQFMEGELAKAISQLPPEQTRVVIAASDEYFHSWPSFANALENVLVGNETPRPLNVSFGTEFNYKYIKSDVEHLISRLQEQGLSVGIEPVQAPTKPVQRSSPTHS